MFTLENINRSIHCTVEDCVHHCGSCDYCSLESIHVGTHECRPEDDRCTDCLSFAEKY